MYDRSVIATVMDTAPPSRSQTDLRMQRQPSRTALHRTRFPTHLACAGSRLAQLPDLDRIASDRVGTIVSDPGLQGQEKYEIPREIPFRVEVCFRESGSGLPLG